MATDNEFIDHIRTSFETDNDPYISEPQAAEAIGEDYPQWQEAVNDGLADYTSAALMASFGVENPYDVAEVGLNHADENWTIDIVYGDEVIEIDLGDNDLPFWVWDWFYEMADDFGWDWEVSYDD